MRPAQQVSFGALSRLVDRIRDFFDKELESLLDDTQRAVFSAGDNLKRKTTTELPRYYDNSSAIARTIEVYPLTRSEEKPPACYVRIHAPIQKTGDYLERLEAGERLNLPRIQNEQDYYQVKRQLTGYNLRSMQGDDGRGYLVITYKSRAIAVYATPDKGGFEERFYELAEQEGDRIG